MFIRRRAATLLLLGAWFACGASAVAAPPEPFLQLDDLSVRAGEPVALRLALPTGEQWETANIAQLVVRTHGAQESLIPVPAEGKDSVTHTFTEPGYALLILSAGTTADRGFSDSWARTPYCSKVVVRVDPPAPPGEADAEPAGEEAKEADGADQADRDADPENTDAAAPPPAGAGLAGKVGQKIEILPLISPASLRPGSDLPVRLYWESGTARGGKVTAYRPDGTQVTLPHEEMPKTIVRINQAGRWLLRFSHVDDGRLYTAELVFDVPAPTPAAAPSAPEKAASPAGAADDATPVRRATDEGGAA